MIPFLPITGFFKLFQVFGGFFYFHLKFLKYLANIILFVSLNFNALIHCSQKMWLINFLLQGGYYYKISACVDVSLAF